MIWNFEICSGLAKRVDRFPLQLQPPPVFKFKLQFKFEFGFECEHGKGGNILGRACQSSALAWLFRGDSQAGIGRGPFDWTVDRYADKRRSQVRKIWIYLKSVLEYWKIWIHTVEIYIVLRGDSQTGIGRGPFDWAIHRYTHKRRSKVRFEYLKVWIHQICNQGVCWIDHVIMWLGQPLHVYISEAFRMFEHMHLFTPFLNVWMFECLKSQHGRVHVVNHLSRHRGAHRAVTRGTFKFEFKYSNRTSLSDACRTHNCTCIHTRDSNTQNPIFKVT
jgi:hypothetical protein